MSPISENRAAAYTLDDLDIDILDLRALLDAACDVLREMPYERNGARDQELDRIASLLRIAQHFSASVDASIQRIGPGIGGWRHDRRDGAGREGAA